MSKLNFTQVVAQDFVQVDAIIRAQLNSRISLINTIADYLLSAGGKRLRPLTALLVGRALNCNDDRLHFVAAIIEFLHTSTLLHDDVVDNSSQRRGKTTANVNWGNAPAVLVGDFLYARSFEMIVNLNNQTIAKIMANATKTLAEGEVMQLTQVHNLHADEATYLDIIKSKTAVLFEAATHSAAILAGADDALILNLQNFGNALGIAFQLTDDALDYQSDSATLGKNIGDDLAEGKPTLPLIYALKNGNIAQQQIIKNAISSKGDGDFAQILQIIKDTRALIYTHNLAKDYAHKAVKYLDQIAPNPFKQSLLELTNFAVERAS